MGRPASGKTTLARHLARVFGGVVVSTAEIKEERLTSFRTEWCFDEGLRDVAYWVALERCRGILASGLMPLVDAGFHKRARRVELYESAVSCGASLLLVYCRCDDLSIVHARIHGRTVGPRSADTHADSLALHEHLDRQFRGAGRE